MNKTISLAAKKDISELKQRIESFKNDITQEERFKAFRLTRGVYGQRQLGVQMVRIKLPFGNITSEQLIKIAEISENHTNGNLHLTTRQNIQIHYIEVSETPAIWEALEEVGVTLRESCGNTVRNITASAFAGIDPLEPFDVSPYAQAVFEYFLRNPICQDMGRKVKIAFSSSKQDSAYTFIHDFGFIPVLKKADGVTQRGFQTLIGGGLGAQAFMAKEATSFLPEDQLIPFIEAGLRVFEHYGERERRNKARLKFLINEKTGIGMEQFMLQLESYRKRLPNQSVTINNTEETTFVDNSETSCNAPISKDFDFEKWRKTNVVSQKQANYYAVKVKVVNGNLSAKQAKTMAVMVKKYASNHMRISVNQGIILRFIREENLYDIYDSLKKLGLNKLGFDTLGDVTSCPGTETCNLGVTDTYNLSEEIEKIIEQEYNELINDSNIKIKISGCINSCGQHMIAQIGLNGSSIKNDGRVVPAMQIVLGGGVSPEGKGLIAEKVIKIPTKRIPSAIKVLLDDFKSHREVNEIYNSYFLRLGKMYFYTLLKPLANLDSLAMSDYQDWGQKEDFLPEIGVGECAGVALDLISTIISDSSEKLLWAKEALKLHKWSHVVFWCKKSIVIGAKAILLMKNIKCNTHESIINNFNEQVYLNGEITLKLPFIELAKLGDKEKPSPEFAETYIQNTTHFLEEIIRLSGKQSEITQNKQVISNYYSA